LASCGFIGKGGLLGGITLASWSGVAETPMPAVYDEPTVLWRMWRANGLMFHAVMGPGSEGAVVAWFLNDRLLGRRAFVDWTSALQWSDQMQAQNWAVGWRFASE
jgi:hypothetical protein